MRKQFMEKHPLLFAVMGVILPLAVLFLTGFIPNTAPFSLGLREAAAALIIFAVYGLFFGFSRLKWNSAGIGYGFRVMRYYYIAIGVLALIVLYETTTLLRNRTEMESLIAQDAANAAVFEPYLNISAGSIARNLVTYLLLFGFVGIVEEFTLRGMTFAGLARCCRDKKNGIVWAAVLSGLLFGFIHIAWDLIDGSVNSTDAMLAAAAKVISAGAFGIVLALIYYRTRNIWVVAALHSLDDMLLAFQTIFLGFEGVGEYTAVGAGEDIRSVLLIQAINTLIMIPAILRCVRALREEDEPAVLPPEADFVPRRIVYVKPIRDNFR